MKTMTARDAKMRFGELLDTMQREPVLLTKSGRPVGVFISIHDAADTLIPEMFMEKEPGYDEWFRAKVTRTLEKMKNGETSYTDHDTVARESLEKVLRRHASTSK